MHLCEYLAYEDGVCFGVACMGMQAILAQDTKTFDARLKMIGDIEKYFINNPDAIQEIQINEEDTSYKILNTILNFLKQQNFIVDDEQIFKELPAFFDGIELYLQPFLYPDFFGEKKPKSQQQLELVIPHVISKKLSKEGIAYASEGFSGVYTHYTSRCEHRRMQNLKVVCNS